MRMMMTKEEKPQCAGLVLVRFQSRDAAARALERIPETKVRTVNITSDRVSAQTEDLARGLVFVRGIGGDCVTQTPLRHTIRNKLGVVWCEGCWK